jgi:hypothetical protein
MIMSPPLILTRLGAGFGKMLYPESLENDFTKTTSPAKELCSIHPLSPTIQPFWESAKIPPSFLPYCSLRNLSTWLFPSNNIRSA